MPGNAAALQLSLDAARLGSFRVPSEVRLVMEGATEWLEWNDSPDAPRSDSPTADSCLSDFIQLVTAPLQQVLAFAGRWGPLRLVTDPNRPRRRAPGRREDGELTWRHWGRLALRSGGRWREPVAGWRLKAYELSGIMTATAHLQEGDDIPAQLRAYAPAATLATVDDQWAFLYSLAARHLSLDDLHLEFRRPQGLDPAKPSSLVFVYGGGWPAPVGQHPLWTVLGVALAAGIVSPIGIYVCSNCNRPFAPKHRPHLTRANHYCQACAFGDRGAKRLSYHKNKRPLKRRSTEEQQTDG